MSIYPNFNKNKDLGGEKISLDKTPIIPYIIVYKVSHFLWRAYNQYGDKTYNS